MPLPDITTLMNTIEQMRRDIAELQQAGGQGGGINRGSAIVVVDSTGSEIARIGRNGSNTADVVELGAANSALYWNTARGIEIPYEHVDAISFYGGYLDVTSGTYVTPWAFVTEYAQTFALKTFGYIGVDAATTGSMRVINFGTGATSNVVNLAASTTHNYACMWDDTSKTLYQGPYTYGIQVKRDSGAGTIHVYPPCLSMGAFESFDGGGGTWTVL